MNLDYKELIPDNFHSGSRVWIYQSSRLLTLGEALQVEEWLNEFINQWNSHGHPVKGYANLFFGQFIILMADEAASGVSGCSTDASVRCIQNIEQKLNIQLFDRQSLAFIVKDKIQLLPFSQLSYSLSNGFISADSLYFNNTIQTKQQLEDHWIIPVKESWLADRIVLQEQAT